MRRKKRRRKQGVFRQEKDLFLCKIRREALSEPTSERSEGMSLADT